MKLIRNNIRLITLIAFSVSLLLPVGPAQAQAGGGGNRNPQYMGDNACLFPMAVGNQWTYDILQKKQKLGELLVKVEGSRTVPWPADGRQLDLNTNSADLKVFTFSFRDSRTGKSYRKDYFYFYRGLYLMKNNRVYPLFKFYMRLGAQIGKMLLVKFEIREFQGKKAQGLTFRHLEKKRSQSFLDGFGLYEYQKDSIIYRMTKAKIKPKVCIEGRQY